MSFSTLVRLIEQTNPAPAATVTTTGTINDLNFSNALLLRMNNASDSTINGFVAGLDGQILTIVSIGAGNVFLAHQNAGSSAANRLINNATSGTTPLAAGSGYATYQYDLTTARWRLISHEQGSIINVAYDVANFVPGSGGTWTVTSGMQTTYGYILIGKLLRLIIRLDGTTTTGAPTRLRVTIPNSFVTAVTIDSDYVAQVNAVIGIASWEATGAGTSVQFFATIGFGAWGASATNNSIFFSDNFPIT